MKLISSIFCIAFVVLTAAHAQVITTVAGNGTEGFCGDGGLATSACLDGPMGVAVDATGNLYIADKNNMRIRKVSPSGIITTVAGNGIGDFTGDVGRATDQSLWFPVDVAVDSTGNLYIADWQNNRIRKVDPKGSMVTVAGGGVCCGLGDGGPATRGTLNEPMAVVVDSVGNLYIADYRHNRVRRVGTNGRIETIAGTGAYGPAGDGGPATAAKITFPQAVVVDAAGNVYIASNERIRKVSPGGTIVAVAGGGTQTGEGVPATTVQIYLNDFVVDRHGDLYFVDYVVRIRLRKVSPDGIITSIMEMPPGMTVRALDSAGNLYLTGPGNLVFKMTF